MASQTGTDEVPAVWTTTDGKATLTASTTIGSSATGTITTTGQNSLTQGTAGGEVLLSAGGAITLLGNITASGGNTTGGSNATRNSAMQAFHVLTGVILLFTVWNKGRKGLYSAEKHWGVEAATVYWHFLDVVWLLLFAVLYF